ncbi:zinc finger, SWIM domain-containing protein [Bifidobacterium samirii]|uniref:Zinc finger, SWIM domain-containing protein n=2 Tax=Bifidobacterium samirii TaxID=2306974 RepID=A0A430FUH5_9BIFI|nr:zinc finger, SWIM domain-containing protein [Bifidobacterium samirii]
MTMMSDADIDEFLQGHHYGLFKPHIYERGHAYYDAGRVGEPEPIAQDLWHAVVRGGDDYQVDVRLHRGRVVSAACSCPYARRAAYCKHAAAVLIAMTELLRRQRDRERGIDPAFPNDASFAVRWYARNQFSSFPRLSDDDWRAVKHILETLYEFPDLEKLFRRMTLGLLGGSDPDEHHGRWTPLNTEPSTMTLTQQLNEAARRKRHKRRDCDSSLANMRLLVPGFGTTQLNELPHTWMTILEAAYEHLHDAEGLRRLYSYYILIAQTDPEAVYVERLRAVSGDHWAEDRDEIIRLRGKCHRICGMSPINPAFERLVREERLPKDAFDYCRQVGGAILSIRMLDVIAQDPELLEQTMQRLRTMLRDPDSDIYSVNDGPSAERVGHWIRRIDTAAGYEEARALAEHIAGMFPRREKLRAALEDYVPKTDTFPELDDDDWDDWDDGDDDGCDDSEIIFYDDGGALPPRDDDVEYDSDEPGEGSDDDE